MTASARIGVMLAWAALFFLSPAAYANVPGGTFVFDGGVQSILPTGSATYLGGSFTQVQAATGSGIVVPASGSGAPDASLFARISGDVDAVAADGSGGWYVGGDFTHVEGIPRSRLAHIRADGSLDTSWNPAPDGSVGDLAVRVPKVGTAMAKTYTLATITRAIAEGAKVSFKPKLSATLQRAIRRALRAGKEITVMLKVVVADGAGNKRTLTRRVKLKL